MSDSFLLETPEMETIDIDAHLLRLDKIAR